jgi:hypothetical protein
MQDLCLTVNPVIEKVVLTETEFIGSRNVPNWADVLGKMAGLKEF